MKYVRIAAIIVMVMVAMGIVGCKEEKESSEGGRSVRTEHPAKPKDHPAH